MVWILLATLIVSAIFFLMVFRQASRAEERLRLLVVKLEGRISHRYGARLVPPDKGAAEEDTQ
ncbi:MAG: hypothetical protein AAB214_13705 [Fibrobacterota bacterium]